MPRRPTAHYQDFLDRLGRNVQRERKNAGLTQEQLAELVDLHPRMIQKIESAETNILVTTAARLEAALGCTLSQLIPKVEIRRHPVATRKR